MQLLISLDLIISGGTPFITYEKLIGFIKKLRVAIQVRVFNLKNFQNLNLMPKVGEEYHPKIACSEM